MGGVAEAAVFFCAVLAYLWRLVIPLPWTGLALAAAIAYSWRRRRLAPADLGLGWRDLVASAAEWRCWWIPITVLFLVLGNRRLLQFSALRSGAVYFAWSAAQQVVYQSMTYLLLRRRLKAGNAAALSGVAFALAHLPNPVLVPATLLWGAASCLLFERRRSIWGLALMQKMLSSMLMWVTPRDLHHGFRIGPYYYLESAGTFAPPIGQTRPGGNHR